VSKTVTTYKVLTLTPDLANNLEEELNTLARQGWVMSGFDAGLVVLTREAPMKMQKASLTKRTTWGV